MSNNDTRINLRINSDVKQAAQDNLQQYGLTLSDYLRMVTTNVANDKIELLNTTNAKSI